jgi:anti-sigma factor RsiW
MDHEQTLDLLPAYLDQELSLSETRDFEHHLEQCAACRQVYEQHRAVSAQLRQAALRIDAPPDLLPRIEAALPGRPASREALNQRLKRWLGSILPARSTVWSPLGAVAVSLAVLGLSVNIYLKVPTAEQRLTQELVDDHVRSLQSNHLFDVISTDKHTVKPWFNGKIDFAPPVIDLAQQGYPLVGGRLDFLNGRAVAVMVYRYKLHPINLYVWPGNDAGASAKIFEQRGYHLAHWSTGGMNYWAITDAGAQELGGFTASLRAQTQS